MGQSYFKEVSREARSLTTYYLQAHASAQGIPLHRRLAEMLRIDPLETLKWRRRLSLAVNNLLQPTLRAEESKGRWLYSIYGSCYAEAADLAQGWIGDEEEGYPRGLTREQFEAIGPPRSFRRYRSEAGVLDRTPSVDCAQDRHGPWEYWDEVPRCCICGASPS